MSRLSIDPDVLQRQRETLTRIIQAERMLIETERIYAELRQLLADARRDRPGDQP